MVTPQATPVQGGMCTPGNPACAPRPVNLAARASPVQFPTMPTSFTNAGRDVTDVYGAQAFLRRKGAEAPDPLRASTMAALGQSVPMADQLRGQGVAPDVADALAMRDALRKGGLTAAGYASNAIPSANVAARGAVEEATFRGFVAGAPSASARAIYDMQPGSIFTDADGAVWQSLGNGQYTQMGVSPEAAAYAGTIPNLLGGQAQQQFLAYQGGQNKLLQELYRQEGSMARTQLQEAERNKRAEAAAAAREKRTGSVRSGPSMLD
jgi:hypothetical protein